MPAKPSHLAKVKRTSAALLRAQEARDLAVVEAVEAGESLRVIGEAAGLSPEGVRQVVRRMKGLSR
jgi:hypothetical protein